MRDREPGRRSPRIGAYGAAPVASSGEHWSVVTRCSPVLPPGTVPVWSCSVRCTSGSRDGSSREASRTNRSSSSSPIPTPQTGTFSCSSPSSATSVSRCGSWPTRAYSLAHSPGSSRTPEGRGSAGQFQADAAHAPTDSDRCRDMPNSMSRAYPHTSGAEPRSAQRLSPVATEPALPVTCERLLPRH